MKLHYSLLIALTASCLMQCSDNQNETKKLSIVETFSKLTSKNQLSKAEKKERKALKQELKTLSKQDYASVYHSQINAALDNDAHKTPETSPIAPKQAPSIRNIKLEDKENKENVRFDRENSVRFYKQDMPVSIALDVLTKNIASLSLSSKSKKTK
jgi:hypothetical protein